jgi:uncharacterized cupin superfamily protein
MLEEKDSGWFVVNVEDAQWLKSDSFGYRCRFEKDERFPETGVGLSILEPGKPNCRYHRESAQEDFLVLSGKCLLLVNGEEREMKAWDYFHCPAGVSHVLVGGGDGPCAVLMIGHRPEKIDLFYPKSEVAARHGAETPEATPDPRVAYADAHRPAPCEKPDWPIS